MHICTSDTATPIVKYLLRIGANANAPPCQNYVSTSQAAVANGRGRFIDALIEAGADVNAYDPNLGTALISSAKYANKKWAYKLLDLGANLHLIGGPYGSALHAAARKGEPELVECLLDEGVDVNLAAGNMAIYFRPLATHAEMSIIYPASDC
jgi:ankyrin repeat protein